MSDINVLIIDCINRKKIDDLKKLLEDNRCTLEILVDILKRFNGCNFKYKQSRETIRTIINEKISELEQEELFRQSKLKMEQDKYKEIQCALTTLGITSDEQRLCRKDLIDLIDKKYKELLLIHHPDKGGTSEKFIELKAAHEQIQQFFHSHKNSDKHILKF